MKKQYFEPSLQEEKLQMDDIILTSGAFAEQEGDEWVDTNPWGE